MQNSRGIFLFILLLQVGYMPAQLSWTALNGPIGLASQAPSVSAGGIVFLNRRNVNQFDISLDAGESWEPRDLPLNTFPSNFQVLHLPNDRTYVLLNGQLYAFRQNTRSWELLPGFDESKRVWFDSRNRLWRTLADGQLAYSEQEGNGFTTVFTDVAYTTQLAMYNDAHNLMVVPDLPDNKVYHFTTAGQKQLISFAANNFYVEWVKFNPYSGTAFMKTNDPAGYLKRSTDGGIHWSAVNLPPELPGVYVSDLLFTNTGETWAINGGTVQISRNEGDTWAPFQLVAPGNIYSGGTVAITANGQNIFFYTANCGEQGFYRSLNHGLDWTDLTSKFKYPGISDIVKTSQGTLYAESCRKFNVEVSKNEGQSWQTLTIPTATGPFIPVSICKSANGSLFAPGNQVMYRSRDNGASWDALAFELFDVNPHHTMSAGPDGSIYLFHHAQGAAYSTDNGASWSAMLVPPDFGREVYFGDQFHPNGNFYRGGQYIIDKFIPGTNQTDYIQKPGGSYIEAFAVTGSGRMLVMTTDITMFTQVLYYSDDEGQSFKEMGPLPEWSSPAKLISGPNLVLLQLKSNYYRSLDDGKTWSLYFTAGDFPSNISCLYFSHDQYLYTGFNGAVIYRTASKVVAVQETLSPPHIKKRYPNPVTDLLFLELSAAGPVQYAVYDALGRIASQNNAHTDAGGTLRIEAGALPPGVYFLEVLDETGRIMGRNTFCKQ